MHEMVDPAKELSPAESSQMRHIWFSFRIDFPITKMSENSSENTGSGLVSALCPDDLHRGVLSFLFYLFLFLRLF